MSWLWDKWLSRSPLGMSLQIVAEQRVRQTEAENLAAITAENLRLERERGEYRKGLHDEIIKLSNLTEVTLALVEKINGQSVRAQQDVGEELADVRRVLFTVRRNMQKVIRERQVAVLISPGYGVGWYSWNTSVPECLFHPEVVAWVEGGKQGSIEEIEEKLFGGHFVSGGGSQLEIHWLPEGEHFRVDEYDGAETLIPFDREDWRQA